MDTKITKSRLDKHMEYDWIKYVLIIVAAIFLWWAVYTVVDNPKGYERMDFFISVNGYYADGESDFKKTVSDSLSAIEDETIRETGIIYFANEMQYQTNALTCDMFIATADKMQNFLPLNLDDEVLELCGINAADYEFYYYEIEEGVFADVPSAIKLTGSKLRQWLPSTVTVTETDTEGNETEKEEEQVYYIGIVGPNIMGAGENIGKFNQKHKEYGQTFHVYKSVLEYYRD